MAVQNQTTQKRQAKLQQIVVNVGEVGPTTGDRFGLLLQYFDKGSNQ